MTEKVFIPLFPPLDSDGFQPSPEPRDRSSLDDDLRSGWTYAPKGLFRSFEVRLADDPVIDWPDPTRTEPFFGLPYELTATGLTEMAEKEPRSEAMRQELDGIVVQMRTIRTALRTHLGDAKAQENQDEILVAMLDGSAALLGDAIAQVEAASYRAPSSF